jgi:hypothetical protein
VILLWQKNWRQASEKGFRMLGFQPKPTIFFGKPCTMPLRPFTVEIRQNGLVALQDRKSAGKKSRQLPALFIKFTDTS